MPNYILKSTRVSEPVTQLINLQVIQSAHYYSNNFLLTGMQNASIANSFIFSPLQSSDSQFSSTIGMFLVTSPIVINVPTRGLLAVETMHAIVQWLANLNIKRNMTSMFVNKKHRYSDVSRYVTYCH